MFCDSVDLITISLSLFGSIIKVFCKHVDKLENFASLRYIMLCFVTICYIRSLAFRSVQWSGVTALCVTSRCIVSVCCVMLHVRHVMLRYVS